MSRKSVKDILKQSRVIAVVGLSSDPAKASHRVASYLRSAGYRVIGVNPRAEQVFGERCYPDLASIPEPVDIVDVFRKAEDVPPVVEEAIRCGAKAVWMQLGIVNEQAATAAREAGLDVVMDACLKIEHQALSDEEELPES